MVRFLVILGILVGVVSVYILTYYFNAKTEAPEDAPLVDCSTCNSTSCSLRKKSVPKTEEECELN